MDDLLFKQFRVYNFRNIDDSGWIPVERVTAFVGRNESGKTALLKALHKFNPGTAEPYNPQREFPRERFTRDFRNGRDWSACAVEFELSPGLRANLKKELGDIDVPSKAVCTRYYDGTLSISYDTSVSDDPVRAEDLAKALDAFAAGARRLAAPSIEPETKTNEIRAALANWATAKKDELADLQDLKNDKGLALIKSVREEANAHSSPQTADLVESLLKTAEDLALRANTKPLPKRLDETIEKHLPVFVYFENYGILDSAIYFPSFLEELKRLPDAPRIRTVNAMFKHVGLTAQEIADLGKEETAAAKAANPPQPVTPEMNTRDRQRVELRSVKLNSASSGHH